MFQNQKKHLLVVLVAPPSILKDRGDKPKVKVEYEKSKGDKDQNPRVGVRVL